MAQVIQLKRKVDGAGVPVSLAPGEPAYNTTGNTLVVGGVDGTPQVLVGSTRQVELTGDQAIDGIKTIPVAKLKILGGTNGDTLKTDGAGNLTLFVAATASAQLFVGSFDATAGTIAWTTGTGTGNALPAADATNNGWYLICDVVGAVPPSGAPAGDYSVGDWLTSNGTDWTHLALGSGSSTTASQVGVTPSVAGGDNVQAALTGLEAGIVAVQDVNATQAAAIAAKADKAYVDAADVTKLTGPAAATVDDIVVFADASGKVAKSAGTSVTALNAAIAAKATATTVVAKTGDTMTGPLVLPATPPALATHAANKAYVDGAAAAAVTGAYTKAESDSRFVNADGDTITGALVMALAAAPLTGTVYLGNTGQRYLHWDGTKYMLPGGPLVVNGQTLPLPNALNDWTQQQTFSGGGTGVAVPIALTNRFVTSANHGLTFDWQLNYNGGAGHYLAGQIALLTTATFDSGSNRSTKWRFNSLRSDVLTAEMDLGGGAVFGTPSGGAKGFGTVNAQEVYDDNAILSCYVLEAFRTGKVNIATWNKLAPDGDHVRARGFSQRLDRVLDVRNYTLAWEETGVLPGFLEPGAEAYPLGEWVSALAEQVELHAGHIAQLADESSAQQAVIDAQAVKITQLETTLQELAARIAALEA